MGMPREAAPVVGWTIVAEVVEQQERIGLARVAETERATQPHAGALDRRLRLDDAFHGTKGHGQFLGKVCGIVRSRPIERGPNLDERRRSSMRRRARSIPGWRSARRQVERQTPTRAANLTQRALE